jgi:hypothetical protein
MGPEFFSKKITSAREAPPTNFLFAAEIPYAREAPLTNFWFAAEFAQRQSGR